MRRQRLLHFERDPAWRSSQGKRIQRDAAWSAFLNHEYRLALGLLVWPLGWTHTRMRRVEER
jgi:hypothetical protein